MKRDFHHLTCQSITHRKELSGEILFPLLPKNCTRFSNINGTGFYTIAFAYYIIRNSRGLDTFYYKENYCYEYDELLFDGNTPEEFIASRPEARLLPSGVRAESEGSSPGNKVTTKSPAIGKCGEWCWQTKLSKKNITSCMDICVSKQEGNPVLRFFVGGVIPKMAASGSTLFQLFQEKKQAKTMKDSESSSKEKKWIFGGSFDTFGRSSPQQVDLIRKGRSARRKADSKNAVITELEVTNVLVAEDWSPDKPLIARLFSGILKDVPQPLVIVRELRSDLWVPVLVTLNPSESIANYGDLLVPYGDARIDQHAS